MAGGTLVAALVIFFISLLIIAPRPEPQRVRKEDKLRKAAQDALDAIGSTHNLVASHDRANRGQHVFNNGLLGFDRSVLQALLSEVGGYHEQLEFLTGNLHMPLSPTVQAAIEDMRASFSWNESYKDFNADVYGEYVSQLRSKLVEYLKAKTSVDRRNINKILLAICQRVQFIADKMVEHEVYVDPMARDRWLEEHPKDKQLYYEVRDALKSMFQNILRNFDKVLDFISDCRSRNDWNWRIPTPRPRPRPVLICSY